MMGPDRPIPITVSRHPYLAGRFTDDGAPGMAVIVLDAFGDAADNIVTWPLKHV